MNIALVLYVVGHVLCMEAVLMLLPIGVAFVTGVGDWMYFVYAMIPLVIVGVLLSFRKPKVTPRIGDGNKWL